MSSEQSCLMSWLIQNLKPGTEAEFVDLIEIKSKYSSSVTCAVVGNLIAKLFKDGKIKPGRCRSNWIKTTQRYYGIIWEEENSPDIQFKNINTFFSLFP